MALPAGKSAVPRTISFPATAACSCRSRIVRTGADAGADPGASAKAFSDRDRIATITSWEAVDMGNLMYLLGLGYAASRSATGKTGKVSGGGRNVGGTQ